MFVKIEGQISSSNICNCFEPGDLADVVWVHQGCPDLGCCEVSIFINFEGTIYKGEAYFENTIPSFPKELIKFSQFPLDFVD